MPRIWNGVAIGDSADARDRTADALGASPGAMQGLLFRQGLRPALIGIAIGMLAASGLTRFDVEAAIRSASAGAGSICRCRGGPGWLRRSGLLCPGASGDPSRSTDDIARRLTLPRAAGYFATRPRQDSAVAKW